jgi:hypothetical protein
MKARCESALRGSIGFWSSVSSVVLVAGPLREHRAEDLDVRHDTGVVLIETRGNGWIQIAGGRVERATKRPRVLIEDVAKPRSEGASDVDDIDACARCELERQLERT